MSAKRNTKLLFFSIKLTSKSDCFLVKNTQSIIASKVSMLKFVPSKFILDNALEPNRSLPLVGGGNIWLNEQSRFIHSQFNKK